MSSAIKHPPKQSLTVTPPPLRTVLLVLASLAVLAWLIANLAPILTPFIAAAIVAYILNPLVLRLCALKLGKFRLPRVLASAIAMLGLLLLLIGLVLIVLPVLRTEASLLQARLPALIETAQIRWLPWLNQQLGTHIALDSSHLKAWLQSLSLGDDTVNHALDVLKNSGTALLGFVGTSVLATVLGFYLLMDLPKLTHNLRMVVPKRWAHELGVLTHECNRVLGQYLRGQLAVMLALCVYYSGALWLAGFDVALPVGVLTGLLIVVPYLGFASGLLLALMAAVLQFSGAQGLISVAVIYGFGQVLEGFFLTPRWVGASLGLHPAAVIFALLAFGQLMGFTGVLLALPLAAVVVVLGKAALNHYVDSDWYRSE
jgi:predicted PurR-regulated permease PerM